MKACIESILAEIAVAKENDNNPAYNICENLLKGVLNKPANETFIFSFSDEELKERNKKSEKLGDKQVLINPTVHKRLKKFAADYGVSMKAVVGCIADKLPE